MGNLIETMHEVHAGNGDWAINLGFVVAISPAELSNEEKFKARFPQASEIWVFAVLLSGQRLGMLFPDDKAACLLERGRIVEALRGFRSLMSADNVATAMKEAGDGPA